MDNDNGGKADRDDPDCYANPTSLDGYDPNRTEANREIMTYDRYFGDVIMSDKWDKRFLHLAKHISEWSKDPSTKVGCIVVGEDREIRSTGFNGFPRGIEDKQERLEDREQKYPMICHAEENAIMHAARIGISLKGTTAYVTWPPCSRCTRSLIQAGVSEVIYPKDLDIPERWQKDFDIASGMMNEAGIIVRTA